MSHGDEQLFFGMELRYHDKERGKRGGTRCVPYYTVITVGFDNRMIRREGVGC